MEFDEKTNVLSREQLAGLRQRPTDEPRAACFIVIAGSQAGRMYKLGRDEVVIGRGQDAAISIQDDGVSRRHASISRLDDGSVSITDLRSTNGTFCNGDRVERRLLQDGDKIQIGTTTILKFSFQDSVEEDFQRRQYESATRDALTECFNKKYFLERLPSELAFARRHNKALSLAIMDIDFFKKINDTHGHQAGDHVLKEVARIIRGSVRADDVVARFGGEEFALIMRETSRGKALVAAERIRKRIESTAFGFGDDRIPVTISIGVATWVDDEVATVEDFIRLADEFLYRAKRNGRNRTESAAAG
jgi:diguanylate cyclase (GGDEF)-like protein